MHIKYISTILVLIFVINNDFFSQINTCLKRSFSMLIEVKSKIFFTLLSRRFLSSSSGRDLILSFRMLVSIEWLSFSSWSLLPISSTRWKNSATKSLLCSISLDKTNLHNKTIFKITAKPLQSLSYHQHLKHHTLRQDKTKVTSRFIIRLDKKRSGIRIKALLKLKKSYKPKYKL